MALVSFSFGGTLTIYPSIISDFFGIKNLAKNYGLLYLGFGIGSLFGYIVAFIFGSYTLTFTLMGGLLVVAIVASLMVKLPPELSESHKQLVKANKLRTPEEAAAAAQAAFTKASEAFPTTEETRAAAAQAPASALSTAQDAEATATATPTASNDAPAVATTANAETEPAATLQSAANSAPEAASAAAAAETDAAETALDNATQAQPPAGTATEAAPAKA